MNVSTRESALHENTPFMSGLIEKACSTEVRSIDSLNVIVMTGVVFAPAPRGAIGVVGPAARDNERARIRLPAPAIHAVDDRRHAARDIRRGQGDDDAR